MKQVDFVICDDIRDEKANKVTLVGIYNDKLKVQGSKPFPAGLVMPMPILSTYIRCLAEPGDQIPAKIRFLISIGTQQILNQEIAAPPLEGSYLVLKFRMPGFPLHFGSLDIKASVLDGSGVEILTASSNPIEILFELLPQ